VRERGNDNGKARYINLSDDEIREAFQKMFMGRELVEKQDVAR
jgi:hypothetical protein